MKAAAHFRPGFSCTQLHRQRGFSPRGIVRHITIIIVTKLIITTIQTWHWLCGHSCQGQLAALRKEPIICPFKPHLAEKTRQESLQQQPWSSSAGRSSWRRTPLENPAARFQMTATTRKSTKMIQLKNEVTKPCRPQLWPRSRTLHQWLQTCKGSQQQAGAGPCILKYSTRTAKAPANLVMALPLLYCT